MVIFRFRGYFGHFLGFGGILVIFRFWGILVIFWVSEVFWSFFGFCGYFGHFLDFRDILVIFLVLGVFW